jgi:hypothetical protein
MALIDGTIMVCDVCLSRKAYDESQPLPRRCWNRECRSLRWNTGGQDRRRWPRVPPDTPAGSTKGSETAKK